MSGWKPYIDLVLKGDGVKAASIHGQDGAKWASSSDDIKLTADEVKALVAGVKDTSKFTASGVVISGVKYMFLRSMDDGEGKNTVVARKGPTTALITLSKKAIIVALTKDGANPANITSHTFVRDDLMKKNF